LGTTDKSGKKLFTKESQVDDLLSLIKDVRGGQIELIEFRCCNLGAGAGLKKIHKLFGSKITAAPKTKYVFLRGTFGGKAKLPKSEAQWNAQLKHNADQIGRLPRIDARSLVTTATCPSSRLPMALRSSLAWR
jgi:hypothetical protein